MCTSLLEVKYTYKHTLTIVNISLMMPLNQDLSQFLMHLRDCGKIHTGYRIIVTNFKMYPVDFPGI